MDYVLKNYVEFWEYLVVGNKVYVEGFLRGSEGGGRDGLVSVLIVFVFSCWVFLFFVLINLEYEVCFIKYNLMCVILVF